LYLCQSESFAKGASWIRFPGAEWRCTPERNGVLRQQPVQWSVNGKNENNIWKLNFGAKALPVAA
jgi:hypothetical protein